MELLATGLQIDTLDEIIAEMDAALLAGIATTLNLQAPDPIAVMTDVVAERLSSLEEQVATMYSGMQPDNATGDALEGLTLITGTTRQPATATVVACSITVDAAFSALAGTMFASVDGVPNVLYTNVDDFTAGGAGTTTGVVFQCTDTGDNVVNASTLIIIAAALTHWTTITNPSPGVSGREIETDAALRLDRQNELALGGATTGAAIAADIRAFMQPSQSPLTIPGILTDPAVATANPFTISATTVSVTVLWNDTNATDSNGLPAHTLEAISYQPGAATEDDDALCALILSDKAAGIGTYSGLGTSKTIVDDQGISTVVYYTRPVALPTLISVAVKQRAGHTVTEAEVQDAIMAYIAGTDRNGAILDGYEGHWTPGATAYASSIVGAIFAYDIPGVANVTGVVLSAANSGVNIVPSIREIVTVTTPTADIVVTIT